MLTVKQKLDKQNIDKCSVIRHGSLPTIRDYEIIFETQDFSDARQFQCILKGCVDVVFKNTLQNKLFSMDERLLENDNHQPDYPYGFVWAEGTSLGAPFILEENTDELKEKENFFGIKFFKFHIQTSVYNLSIIFHDVEVKDIQPKRIKSKVMDTLKKHTDNLKSFL